MLKHPNKTIFKFGALNVFVSEFILVIEDFHITLWRVIPYGALFKCRVNWFSAGIIFFPLLLGYNTHGSPHTKRDSPLHYCATTKRYRTRWWGSVEIERRWETAVCMFSRSDLSVFSTGHHSCHIWALVALSGACVSCGMMSSVFMKVMLIIFNREKLTNIWSTGSIHNQDWQEQPTRGDRVSWISDVL